jgi:hypothetical protein
VPWRVKGRLHARYDWLQRHENDGDGRVGDSIGRGGRSEGRDEKVEVGDEGVERDCLGRWRDGGAIGTCPLAAWQRQPHGRTTPNGKWSSIARLNGCTVTNSPCQMVTILTCCPCCTSVFFAHSSSQISRPLSYQRKNPAQTASLALLCPPPRLPNTHPFELYPLNPRLITSILRAYASVPSAGTTQISNQVASRPKDGLTGHALVQSHFRPLGFSH